MCGLYFVVCACTMHVRVLLLIAASKVLNGKSAASLLARDLKKLAGANKIVGDRERDKERVRE